MTQNICPMKLCRAHGESFDYSMQVITQGGHVYSLYGHDKELRNHFGGVCFLSSQSWLAALDFVDVSITGTNEKDGEDQIIGKGIFVFAETSAGADNLKFVFFCDGK